MKTRLVAALLALITILTFSACTQSNVNKPAEVQGEVDENGKWKPDLSKPMTIELIEKGWINTPTGGNASDPYWSWVKKEFNIDLKLTNTSEFSTSIMVRFASGSPPDIIAFDSADNLRTLYKQGVLIDDWTPYLKHLPTVNKNIGDIARNVFTVDNKLIVLPGSEVKDTYSFRIRKDWLDNLGLAMPTDVDSLLNVARSFTFNDPDRNGKHDTYAFSSAGAGTTMGEIANLLLMWGPSNFYIKDNKVTHPVLDENLQSFLKFMKTVSDEKLIDPDWYIQSWEQRKGQMYRGTYGILWYTGALISELEENNGRSGESAGKWVTMPMPKAAETGGKLEAGDISSSIVTVSAKAAADSEKLSRILYFMESVAYPNEGFYKLRYGDGFDYFLEDAIIEGKNSGYKYLPADKNNFKHYRSAAGVLGSADYGTWIDANVYSVIHSYHNSITPTLQLQIQLEEDALKAERYSNVDNALVLDPLVQTDTSIIFNEFVINYILGYDNDYNTFKSRWLNGGGQSLLDEATQQFKEFKYIK